MKRYVCMMMVLMMIFTSACAASAEEPATTSETAAVTEETPAAAEETPAVAEEASTEAVREEYLILVNKENAIPDDWEGRITLVTEMSVLGYEVSVESETLEQFHKLREAILAEDIDIEIQGGYVSIEGQENAIQMSAQALGEEYVKEHMDAPGYYENHTGLAIDICFLNSSGSPMTERSFMLTDMGYAFSIIQEKLPEYGFITRYPEGKEDVTGHSYEPWHIRYVGSPEIAKEITEQGLTLEEYLAK